MRKNYNINQEINVNLTVGIYEFSLTALFITYRNHSKLFRRGYTHWPYYFLFVSVQVTGVCEYEVNVSASFKFQVLNRNWTSIKLSIFLYFHSSQNFPEIVQVRTLYEEFEQLSRVDKEIPIDKVDNSPPASMKSDNHSR